MTHSAPPLVILITRILQKLERYIRQYEMSPERPWLLQTFLEGPEYSCYTLAYQGTVVAHVDNIAELSCLRYNHVGIPEVNLSLLLLAGQHSA